MPVIQNKIRRFNRRRQSDELERQAQYVFLIFLRFMSSSFYQFYFYVLCHHHFINFTLQRYTLSFNHFCCFYSINHHYVFLNMKDIYPSFVVRHHVPCLRMYATDILGHVLRQEIGQLAKVSSGRCVNLNSVGSHVSSDTWTTIHRNTHPPTDVRVFRRLDNPRAQLLYAHIRPLAQMLSALAFPLFYMVLLPWYYIIFSRCKDTNKYSSGKINVVMRRKKKIFSAKYAENNNFAGYTKQLPPLFEATEVG